MIQGTASHVGKSVMVSALCRIFRQDGFRVAPFKAQNMSNNSYVTRDGGEIGRAQAVQAEAAGVEARVEMNPVLLKPEADHIAQVVLMGRPLVSAKVRDYFGLKPQLWESVHTSLDILRAEYDIVVIEGAGSPAEINLAGPDIANMGFAAAAGLPVALIADIDRGGVIASLIGTWDLLQGRGAERVRGFIVNKFRGDRRLFDGGLEIIAERTGLASFGVVPWFARAHLLPAEDAMALERPAEAKTGPIRIAVPRLAHIANFDDLDPLSAEPEVALEIVPPGRPLPA